MINSSSGEVILALGLIGGGIILTIIDTINYSNNESLSVILVLLGVCLIIWQIYKEDKPNPQSGGGKKLSLRKKVCKENGQAVHKK